MITAVIMDMDGLIFSTEPIYFKCYQQAAAPMGIKFTFELFEACIGMSVADAHPLMKSYFGKDVDVLALHEGCSRNFEEYMRLPPYPLPARGQRGHRIFPRAGVKIGAGYL